MAEVVSVLGVDAADYALAKRWDCENLLLETHRQLTTHSYSGAAPATLEVWPTIATGVPPAEHGVYVHDPDPRGVNRVVGRVKSVLRELPEPVKSRLQKLRGVIRDEGMQVTDHNSVFERGAVHNWPGITPSADWERELTQFRRVVGGDLGERAFSRESMGYAGRGVGWLASQAVDGVPIAGTHVHYLDFMGHLYGNRPERLREHYRAMDDLIGTVRDHLDHLVVVSDHGIQTSLLGDQTPGDHSSRALIASSRETTLPGDITEVREWLESQITTGGDTDGESDSPGTVDAPTSRLKDLGYLN